MRRGIKFYVFFNGMQPDINNACIYFNKCKYIRKKQRNGDNETDRMRVGTFQNIGENSPILIF